ncbi:hypothetical protein PsAD2_00883 [Pseudovibrio axinellae]|uniref:Transglycosylase SLT domain-containing protein n=1 Tax=Pseudovibrio axinellae TaxID=989403 RepID=A0A161VBS5_9HYPH|nr:DUF1402 family protein [Pseudovibrio axinellae]KZL21584.1 hypothetical protein PsAD2_00883 [Pseudovibrio axinellae]SER10536.1 Protein of unknown function [Pseudovibrio axinellae]
MILLYKISAALFVTALLLPASSILTEPAEANVPLVVPAGNRLKIQPDIPSASLTRTQAFNRTYDKKFRRILSVLKRENRLIRKIKKVANLYAIDPVHILGAIVGEHTYNYDSMDSAQGYYMKALQYAKIPISFQYDGEKVWSFVTRPQFNKCRREETSNSRWRCYELVWNTAFMGRTVGGVRYPRQPFHRAFFRPMFAGQSFGLGQITPLTALKMNDMVTSISGLPKLNSKDASGLYKTVMDPNKSIHYTAAVLRDAINAYKKVANVDISKNPGITSTLYNLGNPWERAISYRNKRRIRPSHLPRENYYGWLINARIEELRAVLR